MERMEIGRVPQEVFFLVQRDRAGNPRGLEKALNCFFLTEDEAHWYIEDSTSRDYSVVRGWVYLDKVVHKKSVAL